MAEISDNHKYTLVDLFSGAGGLSTGFHWAGFETIIANEVDPSIGKAYEINFPDTRLIIEDIRAVRFKDHLQELGLRAGDVDVLAGGPPCQGFSMANRKRIQADKRNLLFLEFARAVEEIRPKTFLIENVMGMSSEAVTIGSKQSDVITAMRSYFADIGYAIRFERFKSEEHGVPQIRRRVIIIGTRLDSKMELLTQGQIGELKPEYLSKEKLNNSGQLQYNLFSSAQVDLKMPTTVWDAISDLPILQSGEGADVMAYATGPLNDYQNHLRSRSDQVTCHKATPHSEEALQRIKLIKPGENFKNLPKKLQTKSVHSGAYGRLEPDGLTPTITTRFDTPSTGRVIHPIQDRTLTVREAARLQSFPDDFKFYGTRTSMGKQVGNAVPPLVAQKMGEMFIEDFLSC